LRIASVPPPSSYPIISMTFCEFIVKGIYFIKIGVIHFELNFAKFRIVFNTTETRKTIVTRTIKRNFLKLFGSSLAIITYCFPIKFVQNSLYGLLDYTS